MMNEGIHILSHHLASQIAAGEVVERPASVLKELLENSLDANSQHIEVRILEGGLQEISVTDDGQGILPKDFPLVFHPHATSKITAIQDLHHLSSYGFRGEALASIASVSNVILSSRPKHLETGYRLAVFPGADLSDLCPVPMPPGTQFCIQDLFFNTPARRQFLKSPKTEFLHLESAFKYSALSCPGVALQFFNEGKRLYQLPACQNPSDRLKRVQAFAGKRFLEKALSLEAQSQDLRLSGWIVPPEGANKSPPLQHFFINKRIVKDKVVLHALQQVANQYFPNYRHNQFSYVLFLEIDPESIDINVHPSKQEVRFREPRRVHAFILDTLLSIFKPLFSISQAYFQPISTNPSSSPIPEAEPPKDGLSQPEYHFKPRNAFNQTRSLPPALPSLYGKSTTQSKLNTVKLKPVQLGKALCLIEEQWILSASNTHIFLIDFKLQWQIQFKIEAPLFFTLSDANTLIHQLEKSLETNPVLKGIQQQSQPDFIRLFEPIELLTDKGD